MDQNRSDMQCIFLYLQSRTHVCVQEIEREREGGKEKGGREAKAKL